jgi:hypothetical protein
MDKKNQILPSSDCEDAWVNLCVLWDVNQHYWYPLRQQDPPRNDIVAFYSPFFEEFVGDGGIKRILLQRNIESVIELREGGSCERLPTADVEIYYSGLEGYWTSQAYDWLIYASHEYSITVAGEWLLEELKAIWPTWSKCIYCSPFEEDYKPSS